MPAPASVVELVKRFGEQIEAYKHGKYNETQVRVEFIDPFFNALGWDISNEQGLAPAYKDVIHEDAIKIGIETKAPDYCFRIGGTRKFFLEAKKPAVNIKEDVGPAFQLRRYAWSSKLPLSILTDFEEFAVYDCRIRPQKNDKPSVGRVFYCRFEEYEAKWDEFAGIFSKEAVLKGSFDKYAESNKKKKGTAEVDDAFLEEIESWRETLAKNIALRNPKLSVRELNYSIQQTIDRIIFLRICEDRGIEPYGKLHGLMNGENTYKRLTELFRNADDRYNSGLFHFKAEKDRPAEPDGLTLSLKIDDEAIKDILKNLYYPDSPYEFSVLPADILGQVYEQFLGKVIRLTQGHHAKIEEKPEVRKAGGVYYTPKYIVDYIVKNTVGGLTEGKEPKEVSKLRIVDPACGSGSFLIQAYQYLLDWHRDWYTNHEPEQHAKGKNAANYRSPTGEWLLTSSERKRILLNNIYGVDIDAQAVEVTKLSLLLKVLEGESNQSLNQTLTMFHERALPDLQNNIKCGNSLIGPDYYSGQQITLLDDEERFRVNVFEWSAEFNNVFSQGGFDAVIGNPPYGAVLSDRDVAYISDHYKVQSYQLDTYLVFVEKALSIVKMKCPVGMIIPNTWLLNLTQANIRKFIFDTSELVNIVHYQYYVFKEATVDTEILILRNSEPDASHLIKIDLVSRDRSSGHFIDQGRWQSKAGEPVNILERPEFGCIADNLSKFDTLDETCVITQGAKPFQVGKGKPPQTRKIVDEKPYVSDHKADSTFKPLLRGSLINKYVNTWNKNYWISFGDWLAEPRYSAGYDAPEKLVVRQTGDSLIATYDDKQFIARDNLYTVLPRENGANLKAILGCMNSKLLNWYYQKIINPEQGEALAQVKRGHLARLPMPLIKGVHTNSNLMEKLTELVNVMLDLNRKIKQSNNPQEKSTLSRGNNSTIREIDAAVYGLYQLTDAEVKVVEATSSDQSPADV